MNAKQTYRISFGKLGAQFVYELGKAVNIIIAPNSPVGKGLEFDYLVKEHIFIPYQHNGTNRFAFLDKHFDANHVPIEVGNDNPVVHKVMNGSDGDSHVVNVNGIAYSYKTELRGKNICVMFVKKTGTSDKESIASEEPVTMQERPSLLAISHGFKPNVANNIKPVTQPPPPSTTIADGLAGWKPSSPSPSTWKPSQPVTTPTTPSFLSSSNFVPKTISSSSMSNVSHSTQGNNPDRVVAMFVEVLDMQAKLNAKIDELTKALVMTMSNK